jgi:predicted amidohydrolase YtcJ
MPNGIKIKRSPCAIARSLRLARLGFAAAAVAGVAALAGVAAAQSPAQLPDLVLTNGKIVTVDERFSIVQALAVKDGRIVAAGRNADIAKLAGKGTRRIDLRGKTVIPGLIDNHAHFVRAAQHWDLEVRWDGVTSRQKALQMLAERVRRAKPGEWIAVLGGWSFDQFTDSREPFTRAELDQVAPDNPLALQLIYVRVFLNGRAIDALKLSDPDLAIRGAKVVRDYYGIPTGLLEGGGASGFLRQKLPMGDAEAQVAGTKRLLTELNRMGLTTFIDWGGFGFTDALYKPFETLNSRRELTTRVFHSAWVAPTNALETDLAVERARKLVARQGDDWFGNIGWGETVFLPLHDNPIPKGVTIKPEELALWRKVAEVLAERRVNLSVHANQHDTIAAFLGEMEAIDSVHSIRGLRWSLAHVRELQSADILRVRKLDLYLMAHSQATISGASLHAAYGESAWDQTPLGMIQDSGIPWGLGSDSNGAAPANPFYTLWWAVTGKMLGGRKVSRQTITREQALVAHTRNNAAFAFQEANIGSLTKGKYADLVVLDRDYLKVPVEQIRQIRPLLTMVGGKIVYDAKAK